MGNPGSALFGVFIAVMGAWMILLGRNSARKLELARNWPSTQATITQSEVKKMPGANARYRFEVRYQYQVAGETYTGKRIAIGGEINSGRTRAEKRQATYPEGSSHPVYYDPEDPAEAYLEPVVEGGGRIELAGGVLGLMVGALLMVGAIG